MPFPFAPILLGSHMLVAATGGIPSVDIHKTCRAAASVMTGLLSGTTAEHDQDVCVSSEQAAPGRLIPRLSGRSACGQRSICRAMSNG